MSLEIIQQRLSSYDCQTTQEEQQALREITQEIVLSGLGRTDFFSGVAFQGGTCLRIFHHLGRFSEDLDFALDEPDPNFELSPYLDALRDELAAYGYELETADRSKVGSAVRKAFLKDDSIGGLLRLRYRSRTGPMRKLRIKLEVDTNPPVGASYEMPILDFPFPSAVRIFDLPSLFAGKIHALLCRPYDKGRDWYDFAWYTAHRAPINHGLLSAALNQQGPWAGRGLSTDDAWCAEQLGSKIREIDWQRAREEVEPFVSARELPSLKLWTAELFLRQTEKLVQG